MRVSTLVLLGYKLMANVYNLSAIVEQASNLRGTGAGPYTYTVLV